jgi:hypothetical protein
VKCIGKKSHNDNVCGVGKLSDPRNGKTNVSDLFDEHRRNGRSHGHMKSSNATKHDHITIDSLITNSKSDLFGILERRLNSIHNKSPAMKWLNTIPDILNHIRSDCLPEI